MAKLSFVMATTSDENREHWLELARKTARQVNLAWWLDRLAAPLVVTATAGACALLLTRREVPGAPVWWFAAGIAAVLVILFTIAWTIARRRFEKPMESLVRIEATMRLRNALSAADAGVAPWPNPPPEVDAGVRWNWPRLLVPILGALVLLAAGLFIPVSKSAAAKQQVEEPQAWQKIDATLDELAKDAVVDESYLEEKRKQLEELREKDPEEWFSHSSLEATDELKKAMKSELADMQRELGRAEKALGDLQKNTGGSQAEQAKLANEFEQALQGLQNGGMKPNPELLNKLKQFDPKNLGQVSPEQLQQMKENLQKAGQAMKDAQGQQGQGQGEDWADQLLAGEGDQPGQGNGDGEGEGEGEGDGEGAGKGGVGRGPGHAPGVLGKEKDKLATGKLEGLDSKDLSRATPGSLLQLQDGEHEVDKSASKTGSGGDTTATGQGGDRVWKESLDPSEQRAMKKFFE